LLPDAAAIDGVYVDGLARAEMGVASAMEANEAMRRIFFRHRWLLIILTLVPIAGMASYLVTRPITYAATASIQAQAAEPQAQTQAAAILSQVTAIATSPVQVQAAITTARADRNALTLARHHITVTSLGTSAVVSVTVTDSSPQVAIALTNALAGGIVSKLNGLGTQSASQLAALADQRAQLTADKAKLLSQLSSTRLPATSAVVQGMIAQLNAVENQLTANATSVQQVMANSTINEGADVISLPSFAVSQSRHVATESALAGLLGLVIGLLIATIRELSWPTLADPGAAARELSLVLVGNAQVTRDNAARGDSELAIRLDLAAHRLGASTLVLTGPVPPAQLRALARELDDTVPAGEPPIGSGQPADGVRVPVIKALSSHSSPNGDTRTPNGSFSTVSSRTLNAGTARAGLTVAALPDLTLRARPEDPALVLVLPRFARRAALDAAVDLGVTTGWPVLGVIGLRQVRARRLRPALDEPTFAAVVAVDDPADNDGGAGSTQKPGPAAKPGGKTHIGAAL
jgi:capsular polysaccharide biosynthesis protein